MARGDCANSTQLPWPLSAFYISVVLANLWGGDFHPSLCTDEETEAQRCKGMWLTPATSEWHFPRSLGPKALTWSEEKLNNEVTKAALLTAAHPDTIRWSVRHALVPARAVSGPGKEPSAPCSQPSLSHGVSACSQSWSEGTIANITELFTMTASVAFISVSDVN